MIVPRIHYGYYYTEVGNQICQAVILHYHRALSRSVRKVFASDEDTTTSTHTILSFLLLRQQLFD